MYGCVYNILRRGWEWSDENENVYNLLEISYDRDVKVPLSELRKTQKHNEIQRRWTKS